MLVLFLEYPLSLFDLREAWLSPKDPAASGALSGRHGAGSPGFLLIATSRPFSHPPRHALIASDGVAHCPWCHRCPPSAPSFQAPARTATHQMASVRSAFPADPAVRVLKPRPGAGSWALARKDVTPGRPPPRLASHFLYGWAIPFDKQIGYCFLS